MNCYVNLKDVITYENTEMWYIIVYETTINQRQNHVDVHNYWRALSTVMGLDIKSIKFICFVVYQNVSENIYLH